MAGLPGKEYIFLYCAPLWDAPPVSFTCSESILGMWGAGFLGIVFALSFCPVSAALFFGSLFSLAIAHGSKIILPSL